MKVSRQDLLGGLTLVAVTAASAAPAGALSGRRYGTVGMTKPNIVQGPVEELIPYIRKNAQKATNPDAIYMLGSGWHTLDIIEPLEKEFGIPVFHPVIVRAWEIQKRLKIHVPKSGYGRLMPELP